MNGACREDKFHLFYAVYKNFINIVSFLFSIYCFSYLCGQKISMMKIKPLLVLFLATLFYSCSNKGVYSGADSAKREFRGAWIQCVNGQFQNLGTERMKQNLTQQLNELQKDGVNAIIFQVRPECDALYKSPYEPWSRFLTGVQ